MYDDLQTPQTQKISDANRLGLAKPATLTHAPKQLGQTQMKLNTDSLAKAQTERYAAKFLTEMHERFTQSEGSSARAAVIDRAVGGTESTRFDQSKKKQPSVKAPTGLQQDLTKLPRTPKTQTQTRQMPNLSQ